MSSGCAASPRPSTLFKRFASSVRDQDVVHDAQGVFAANNQNAADTPVTGFIIP